MTTRDSEVGDPPEADGGGYTYRLEVTPAFSPQAIQQRTEENGLVRLNGEPAYWTCVWLVVHIGEDYIWILLPVLITFGPSKGPSTADAEAASAT